MSENRISEPVKDGNVHVYQGNHGHVMSAECWCLPTVVELPGQQQLVIHNQFPAGVKPPEREC